MHVAPRFESIDGVGTDSPMSVFLPHPPSALQLLPYNASNPSRSDAPGSLQESRDGSFSAQHGLTSQPNSFYIQTPHLPVQTRFSTSRMTHQPPSGLPQSMSHGVTHQLPSGSAHSMTSQQALPSRPPTSPASSVTSNSTRLPPSMTIHNSFTTHTLHTSPRHIRGPANSFTSTPASSFTAAMQDLPQHAGLVPSSPAGSFTASATIPGPRQLVRTVIPTSSPSGSFTAEAQGVTPQRYPASPTTTSPRASRQGPVNFAYQSSPLSVVSSRQLAGTPGDGIPTDTQAVHADGAGALVRQSDSLAGSFSSKHMGVLTNLVGSFSDPVRQGPSAYSHMRPLVVVEPPLMPATPEPSAPPLPNQNVV